VLTPVGFTLNAIARTFGLFARASGRVLRGIQGRDVEF
jgi:hypothetical protein